MSRSCRWVMAGSRIAAASASVHVAPTLTTTRPETAGACVGQCALVPFGGWLRCVAVEQDHRLRTRLACCICGRPVHGDSSRTTGSAGSRNDRDQRRPLPRPIAARRRGSSDRPAPATSPPRFLASVGACPTSAVTVRARGAHHDLPAYRSYSSLANARCSLHDRPCRVPRFSGGWPHAGPCPALVSARGSRHDRPFAALEDARGWLRDRRDLDRPFRGSQVTRLGCSVVPHQRGPEVADFEPSAWRRVHVARMVGVAADDVA